MDLYAIVENMDAGREGLTCQNQNLKTRRYIMLILKIKIVEKMYFFPSAK
jgi:hypothetical protein